jgi:uncharacterized protein (TIGR00369 family)
VAEDDNRAADARKRERLELVLDPRTCAYSQQPFGLAEARRSAGSEQDHSHSFETLERQHRHSLESTMPRMQPRNPAFEEKVRAIVDKAAFVGDVGIVVASLGLGWCESTIDVLPRHLQQNGYVHAGVLATMGDHTAGAAAGTLVGADEGVLTIEFKINLLRPARGPRVRCRSQVLRQGRMLTVVESEVFGPSQDGEKLVAKATVTLAVVPDTML